MEIDYGREEIRVGAGRGEHRGTNKRNERYAYMNEAS